MDGDIDSGICGGANDLILYLQEQQQPGRLSFIAIYHEIDSTSFELTCSCRDCVVVFWTILSTGVATGQHADGDPNMA